MRFNGFSSVTSGTSFTQERLKHLSHLQLDGLCDNGGISVLNLPQLTYLKLTMELGWDGVGIFPLEIQMPKVTTICIDGWVNSRYAVSVSEFLLSTVSSLVNLLLPYNGENGHNIFSVLNLEKFEKLSAFGVGIRNLTRILSTSLDTPPLLFHPSLSLVMFGLDAHNRKDCFKFRKEYVRTLIRRLTGSASLFSKLVIPLEWAELQDLWVQACEKFDLGDGFSKEDPLPCYWSVLNQVDKSNIPIEDRNGVGIREGAGAIFAERMREYSENLEYTERRWSWIELWCKNWNHWDYRTEWEEEDWP
ncbi:hypothetical protein FRC17_006569 [Serendipita sp. 399]|nr:hypothetical protein FRC17_006569 [Serendipita sp. 399]